MEYHITKLPKSEIEIEVVIPFEEFKPRLKKAVNLISQEVEVEGFRRGRAPEELIKSKVGEMAIYERAAEIAVKEEYPAIMEGVSRDFSKKIKNFSVIGQPDISVTKLAPSNEFRFKIKIATLPDFELPDYKSIAKKINANKKSVSVSEEEVEAALKWVRESRASLITVARAAQKNDAVNIDFEISQGGNPLENGKFQNYSLIVGEGQFVPGFEEALAGMKHGEEKIFSLKMPDDYKEKSLAGKNLDFKVRMNFVQERQIPELNDEFAQRLGNFSSIDALKKSIGEGIMAEKQEKENERIRLAIVDEIASSVRMELPQPLIDSELKKMVAELKSGVENMGMNWSDYLTHIKKDEAGLKKEWVGDAERRVKIALVLRKIAETENIVPGEEEIISSANRFLTRYGSPEEAKKSIDEEALRDYAKNIARNELVFKFLESVN
jgi:trigger factor